MNTTVIAIPTAQISDWRSFHEVFERTLGFFPYYGQNMDAWIDCMSSVDDPDAGMIAEPIARGDLLALRLDDAADFQARCPEQYRALLECTAFVNYRRMEVGEPPVLSLLLSGWFAKA